MRLSSIIAAAVTLAVVASAQAAKPSPPEMVRPVSRGPLSVETIAEFVTRDPDGTSTSRIDKNKVYRDAAGRLRSEMEVRDAFGGPVLVIILVDPVENSITVLETSKKIAHRVKGEDPAGGIRRKQRPHWIDHSVRQEDAED